LKAMWTSFVENAGTNVVSSGLIQTGTGSKVAFIYASYAVAATRNKTVELNYTGNGLGTDQLVGFSGANTLKTGNFAFNSSYALLWGAAGQTVYLTGATGTETSIKSGATPVYVGTSAKSYQFGLNWTGYSNELFRQNYYTTLNASDTTLSTSAYLFVGVVAGTSSPINWVRARDSPILLPSVVMTSVPGAVTSLVVGAPLPGALPLTWTNPTGGGLVNNTIRGWGGAACTAPTAALFNISTGGATTSATVSNLLFNVTYAFEVQAWNASGGGLFSACAHGTTLNQPLGLASGFAGSALLLIVLLSGALGIAVVMTLAFAKGRR